MMAFRNSSFRRVKLQFVSTEQNQTNKVDSKFQCLCLSTNQEAKFSIQAKFLREKVVIFKSATINLDDILQMSNFKISWWSNKFWVRASTLRQVSDLNLKAKQEEESEIAVVCLFTKETPSFSFQEVLLGLVFTHVGHLSLNSLSSEGNLYWCALTERGTKGLVGKNQGDSNETWKKGKHKLW